MKKIINSEPAGYPKSSISEINAVNVLTSSLNTSRTRAEIKTLDKVPNIDGYIEILTETLIPIGKLEVQVKALEKKNNSTPKFQCSKEFLAYCENSISPVLLIVVDVENKISYWQHISITLLQSLSEKIKKESVNLDFDKENFITNSSSGYLEKWITILNDYQTKILDYDNLNLRKTQIELELNELKTTTNNSVGEKNPIYSEIHVFLDIYNNLLDGDFKTIKSILYPAFWKIGLGYGSYNQTSIDFMLYPILYDVNDVLIKQFESEHIFKMNGALKIVGHHKENPIKIRPKKYAYELIEKDFKDALKEQPFVVKNIFLAKEYIFAFIDKFHQILGLEANQQEYSIPDIEYSIYRFLPFFISQNIYMTEQMKGQLLSFDIDNFYIHYQAKPLLKAITNAKKELQNNPLSEIPKVYLITKEFNIDVLLVLLGFLRQEKIKEIKREYDIKNIIKDRIYFKWEAWSNDSILKNLELFYLNFSQIYDSIISTYFPNLFEDLKFYNDFNLLIIVVDFEHKNEMEGIVTEYFYLNCKDTLENKTVIFDSKDLAVPIRRKTARAIFENGLTYDNNSYKLRCQVNSYLRFLFGKTPILTAANELMKERLNDYFKEKQSN